IFKNVRAVEAEPSAPGRAPFTAEPLMSAHPRNGLWKEKRLDADPEALAADIRRDEKKQEQLSDQPITVAVAVTEPKGAAASNPHAFRQSEQTPRLLVFGDATWITNEGLSRGRLQYSLFYSCLSWMRERPDIGETIPPTQTTEFQLPETVTKESKARLLALPGFLL